MCEYKYAVCRGICQKSQPGIIPSWEVKVTQDIDNLEDAIRLCIKLLKKWDRFSKDEEYGRVYEDNTYNVWIDGYTGDCFSSNPEDGCLFADFSTDEDGLGKAEFYLNGYLAGKRDRS